MNLIPVIVDKEQYGERSYDIFSRLLKDRIIFISGEINESLANSVIAQLLYLDSIETKDIYLYINSPGGIVSQGMAIYDTMNYIKSDVSTICIGLAASMGAFLLLSGTSGKRIALENSEIMIHQPLGGTEGQVTDIKIATDRLIKIKKKLNNIISLKTNQSIKKVEKDTERDYYMDSYEAKEYGIIDKVIKKKETN
ncbi:MAG: ATP-dependent Clp protease proteolytic subunit [Bacilli bacterium]|nr:ATP-dependent Clp protease proteolytic subunit [Bacilli bacterium]